MCYNKYYMKNKCLFHLENSAVWEVYNNNPNYYIEEDENLKNRNDEWCAIYFSSHAIYFPNDLSTFTERIVKTNRYDWKKIRSRELKNIFLLEMFLNNGMLRE